MRMASDLLQQRWIETIRDAAINKILEKRHKDMMGVEFKNNDGGRRYKW